MKRVFGLILIIPLLLGACSQDGGPTALPTDEGVVNPSVTTEARPTITVDEPQESPPGLTQESQPDLITKSKTLQLSDLTPLDYQAPQLPTERNEYFSASGGCTLCHTDMVDEAGNNVSTDEFWRSAIMANAARDPYWQASVKSQLINTPDLSDFIEDKCATCHMPMGRFSVAQEDRPGLIFEDGFLNPDNNLHTIAMEGVSCTLCHQVEARNFGEESSFSGHFLINTERPYGLRWVFGPFSVTERLAAIMQGPSGFIPKHSEHVDQSELCATCHTLYTPFVNNDGEVEGDFPEQVPYLEWYHSEFRESQSCQDCHMPLASGGVVLSITGGEPRSPFFRHLFVGGNTYMLRILRSFGENIGVTASSGQFEHKIRDTLNQLENRTAKLTIEDASISGDDLTVSVMAESQTGHKFPTAFPSRRAWLHFTVEDAQGTIIFESGGYNPDGSIIGNDNDLDAGAYESHYEMIHSPDQVQIYEAILQDTNDEVTTALLRAMGYLKDNRILPGGFDKATAGGDIAVKGAAFEDDNFVAGGDRIRYVIDLGEASGPYKVTIELLYQSIGYRWAIKLDQDNAPETQQFLKYYEATPNWPVRIAIDSIDVNGE